MTTSEERRAIIIGGPIESNRIKELINRSRDHIDIIGTVSPDGDLEIEQQHTLGSLTQLSDIVRVHRIREIIFSAQDVPFSEFTSQMTALGPSFRYMLAASSTMNIVGSMNRDTEGESYAIQVHFKLSRPASLRAKRIFDLISAGILLLASPVIYFFIKPNNYLLQNILNVLTGRRTWISYDPADQMRSSLPHIKKGILSPSHAGDQLASSRRLEYIHYVYARDYHWTSDLSLLASQLNKIGQKPL